MTNRLILVSPVFFGACSLLKLSNNIDLMCWLMIFKRSIFIYSKDERQIKETYEQLFTIDLVSTFLWNWEEKILKSNLPKNLL